ncbi:hypothetical protein CHS0354_022051 [Potamilus streckersoni]|uniref:Tetraspanin-31 n=1 Tax=Potamilus streckersoni TaxID=2493646 RepID=A0AAE0W027_9BIVA|nr:hypothetical protein CHS0354_022051 [Potamilus streckersoni]
MVCGGFGCSRNSLITLNVLYILVALILITVSAVGKAAAMVTDIGLVGSIIACGVFLFLIALIGLIGAIKHHQVLLFFYMVILFLLFLLQFSLACACLAMNDAQKESLAQHGWSIASNDLKSNVQYHFQCCGFSKSELNVSESMGHPVCDGLQCCIDNKESAVCCIGANGSSSVECPCKTCLEVLKDRIKMSLTVTGGIGLFFSFTEILGVWLAMRYRNQKDPRANPSAFL